MPADPADRAGEAFGIAESRAGSLHVLAVEGAVDIRGALALGHGLLAALNDGARRVLLDLTRAHPLASGALLGTVLRIDRYATRREARLVVLSGAATDPMFQLADAHGQMTIVTTRAEADALLA
jgi:hypothetical protein